MNIKHPFRANLTKPTRARRNGDGLLPPRRDAPRPCPLVDGLDIGADFGSECLPSGPFGYQAGNCCYIFHAPTLDVSSNFGKWKYLLLEILPNNIFSGYAEKVRSYAKD